jgi:hypothetical protein
MGNWFWKTGRRDGSTSQKGIPMQEEEDWSPISFMRFEKRKRSYGFDVVNKKLSRRWEKMMMDGIGTLLSPSYQGDHL